MSDKARNRWEDYCKSQQSHNLACKIVQTLPKGWSAKRWGWGLTGAYLRMWPKPNPESNTAIRLYAIVSWGHYNIMCHPCPLISNLQSLITYLYGKTCPILSFLEYPRGESQISTWIFFIFHVGVIHFLRSFIWFFRSFISFLRGIFYSPRGDFEISTWKSLFPDIAPFRYVVCSKLL